MAKQRIEPGKKTREEKPEISEKTETKIVNEIRVDIKSDAFSPEERIKIIQMVKDDAEHGENIQKDYVEQKKLDLKHYHSEKPSLIEGLNKRKWQSDKNLGLARAVADSFQSTLLATSWNPDTINFIATNLLEIDNRENQEKFTKWGMGKQEANMFPQVDDFIHNRIVSGSSYFKIYRKEWDEWVDKRIPVKNKKGNTYKYEIKTEKVKMSKGVIENIADIDDLLMPAYGSNIQELPFFIHILHLDGEGVLDNIKKKVFIPLDKEEYKKKLKNHAYKEKERTLGEEKLKNLKITEDSMNDTDVRRLSIDVYEWYGYYNKNNRNERYRFRVDLVNDEFLSGKPVRKINRSGKIPFAGGGLSKEPGQLRSVSLMQIIAPIVNAFNNVYNSKSDFQYVTNIPFGFHNVDEGYTQQVYEIEPGTSFGVSGDPSKVVYFPNLQRSMAWAESDIRILFELLERLTGAASYFSVGQQRNKTLGQDLLVDKQSETRFSLWDKRIRTDVCEAVGMWFELYQDYPPKGLAERVVGEDGKKLFHNLSIDNLRGDTAVQMTPDVVAGSKAYRRQLRLWAFEAGQNMIWNSPQVNPKGNYNLCSDTFKEILNASDNDVERYLGKAPKAQYDEAEMGNEWYRFISGEDFDPPEGETQLALQHLEGHMKQKEEKYHELKEECRPNFDAHLFKTTINVMKFMRNAQRDQIVNALASRDIMQREGGMEPQQPGGGGQPPQPRREVLPPAGGTNA